MMSKYFNIVLEPHGSAVPTPKAAKWCYQMPTDILCVYIMSTLKVQCLLWCCAQGLYVPGSTPYQNNLGTELFQSDLCRGVLRDAHNFSQLVLLVRPSQLLFIYTQLVEEVFFCKNCIQRIYPSIRCMHTYAEKYDYVRNIEVWMLA